MMRLRPSFVGLIFFALGGLLCLAASSAAPADTAKPKAEPPRTNAVSSLKLEAMLIWGTNDHQSPDPTHKPVDAEILKKLQGFPLKWTNYFVVNRQSVEVVPGTPVKTSLSDKFQVELRNLGNTNLEVVYLGKGEPVVKGPLPKGETFIVGGHAPDATSWLIAVRRRE